MKKLIFVLGMLGLLTMLPARVAWAQLAVPNEMGVSMGHIHFAVQDMEAAKTFWTAMGGIPSKIAKDVRTNTMFERSQSVRCTSGCTACICW